MKENFCYTKSFISYWGIAYPSTLYELGKNYFWHHFIDYCLFFNKIRSEAILITNKKI